MIRLSSVKNICLLLSHVKKKKEKQCDGIINYYFFASLLYLPHYINPKHISFFHREEFDEEKEPDGMLLLGWTLSPGVEKDDNKAVGNGGSSTSNASPAMLEEADIEIVPAGKKRKLGEISKAASNPELSDVADGAKNDQKREVLDDDDGVVVMLDGENLDINKKKKLL